MDDKRKAPCCLMAAWVLLWDIHGQAGDDVEGLVGEVFCDGFYVGVDDGLFAGSALQIL